MLGDFTSNLEQKITYEAQMESMDREDYPRFELLHLLWKEEQLQNEYDAVADTETEFLNNLAEELGTTDVAKTDAREYALVLAHERPELVAELMQEDGYGELD